MMDTIRADFYRLFRSKGFWIAEACLLGTILLGALYRVAGRFGASVSTNNGPDAVNHAEKMTGINALAHFAGNSDTLIFFTLVIVCLLLGVDLSRKLYKNVLSYGISKREFFFSKVLVSSLAAAFQFVLLLAVSFIIASLVNGIGRVPDHFWSRLLLTSLVQLSITLAWIGIASFALYLSRSIATVFVAFFIGSGLLTLPLVFYPDIEWLRYLTMRFGIDMAADLAVVAKAGLTGLILATLFLGAGLLVFQKKDL